MPLVVGGIIGYYERGSISSVSKTTGDVRGLMIGTNDLDSNSINMNTESGWSNGGPDTSNQAVNSERVQCRVGAYIGLSYSGDFVKVGETKHVYRNNTNNGNIGRAIRLNGNDQKFGQYLNYTNAKSGYFDVNGFDNDGVYYYFGNTKYLVSPNFISSGSDVFANNNRQITYNNFNHRRARTGRRRFWCSRRQGSLRLPPRR